MTPLTTYLVWFFFTIQHVTTMSDVDSCLEEAHHVMQSGNATIAMCLITEYPKVAQP